MFRITAEVQIIHAAPLWHPCYKEQKNSQLKNATENQIPHISESSPWDFTMPLMLKNKTEDEKRDIWASGYC